MGAGQAANARQDAYATAGPQVVPFVGIEQPTAQSAVVQNNQVKLLNSHEGRDLFGDGTVPRVSATPIELGNDPREIYAAESHGAIQNADDTLVNLKGVLTRSVIDLRLFQSAADLATLRLEINDALLPGEPLRVRVRPSTGAPKVLVNLTPVAGGESIEASLSRDAEPRWQVGEFELGAGIWRVTVQADGATPVSDLVVVAAS